MKNLPTSQTARLLGGGAVDRILVTGASGFFGCALVPALYAHRYDLRPVVRQGGTLYQFIVEEICADTDWSNALCDVDAVVDLAARVHVLHGSAGNPLAEFREINAVVLRAMDIYRWCKESPALASLSGKPKASSATCMEIEAECSGQ